MQYFQFYNIGLYDFSSVRNCSDLFKRKKKTPQWNFASITISIRALRLVALDCLDNSLTETGQDRLHYHFPVVAVDFKDKTRSKERAT